MNARRGLKLTPCRSCGALIVFLRNETPDRSSDWLVVNPDPVDDGNIVVNEYRRTGVVLSGEALTTARADGYSLHEVHHRTCPSADAHRRRKTTPTDDTPTLFEEEE